MSGRPWQHDEDCVRIWCLEEDWDSYGARPVTQAALETAWRLLQASRDAGSRRPAIVPTSQGGIQLEWAGERDVEIEIDGSGRVCGVWVE